MKVIVSHDIDHLTVSEHLNKDLIVPKYLLRSKIEFITGKISWKELFLRMQDLFKNKWQHLHELNQFNVTQGVQSTYFIAVQQGLGLSYSLDQTIFWVNELKSWGCELGLHGIEFEDFEGIFKEYKSFRDIVGDVSFGTRMHYIRRNEQTLTNMARAGYIYDSSEMSFTAPYKVQGMWEFPFHIMDGYIIEKPKQWQSADLKQSKEKTMRIIDEWHHHQLPYLIIDFHDRYFSRSHQTWMDWYMWLIEYLRSNGADFINFHNAIKELDNHTFENNS
jgi:hypothetical protein